MGAGVIGLEAQGSSITLLGFREPSRLAEQVPQVVMGIDFIRIEPQHMAKAFGCVRERLLVLERQTQLFERVHAIGFKPQRSSITLDGRRCLPHFRQR